MAAWRCQDCSAPFGAWLSRCPRCASTKELVMALSVCTGCSTKYAVGLPKCPHCGSAEHVEDGQPMPKITAHGGPSDKTLADEPDTTAADVPEPETEGGEESSPGTSSSTSTETPSPKPEPSSKPAPSPAPTTASPSKRARTASSTARRTAGGRADGTSATGSVPETGGEQV